MKGIKKIHLTAIAFAVAQFACASAYAATSSDQMTTAREVYKYPECLQGDGNSFLSASPQTNVNTEEQKQKLALAYMDELDRTFVFPPQQAAGIVANLLWESGLNSGMKGTGSLGEEKMNGDASDERGYGVAQWTGDRKANLIDWAGKMKIPTSSQCANFNHLANELIFDPRFRKVVQAVHDQGTLIGAVCAFEKLYQMPKDPNSQKRIELAKQILTWHDNRGTHNWGPRAVGSGSASGDACDYFPGPQPDDKGSNPPRKGPSPSLGPENLKDLASDESKDGRSSPMNIRGPGPAKVTKPETDHGPIPVDPDGKICKWKLGDLEMYGPCPIKWPSNEDSPPKQENGPGPGPDHDHQQHVWKSPFSNPSGK